MQQRPEAGSIPDTPGSYQFKDAHGRVLYVGKATSLRSRLSNYFGPPESLLPRTRQMVAAADDGRVDRGPQRGRGAVPRVQPDQAAPAPLQHPLQGRQVLPVPRGHARRGVAAGDGHAGREAQGRPRTSGRTRTRTRSARPSTSCCARSRSARARRHKFDRHHRLGRPCLYAHIEKCAAPCVGDIDAPRSTTRSSTSCSPSSTASTAPVLQRLERQMHEASDELEFERAARLRDQLVSVRKAIERQQMVAAEGGGLRRHRPRRGPARGVGPGVLRPAGPGRRAAGLRGRQGRGRRRRRRSSAAPRAALRRRHAGGRPP